VTSRRSPIRSAVATTKGDDGTTGLLFGRERVSKDDPRTEAYGTIDEAVAALGLARASLGGEAHPRTVASPAGRLADRILHYQRELFVVGAELATSAGARDRLEAGRTRVSAEMLRGVERDLLEFERAIELPREFVVPGETPASAGLELARTVLRRAERRAVGLARAGVLGDSLVVPYLNRLADLLWVLARHAEQADARSAVRARVSPPAG